MLHNGGWQLVTDVSGKTISTIYKDQAVGEEMGERVDEYTGDSVKGGWFFAKSGCWTTFPLKMDAICFPAMSVTNHKPTPRIPSL
jgi:hypothetical protein